MFRKSLVIFLVAFELLLLVSAHAAIDRLFLLLAFKDALDHRKFSLVRDILGIHRVQVALAEGKVMDGIEQVGLPYPVFTHETIDPRAQLQVCLRIILEINYRKCL
jgi:hypothetical protein